MQGQCKAAMLSHDSGTHLQLETPAPEHVRKRSSWRPAHTCTHSHVCRECYRLVLASLWVTVIMLTITLVSFAAEKVHLPVRASGDEKRSCALTCRAVDVHLAFILSKCTRNDAHCFWQVLPQAEGVEVSDLVAHMPHIVPLGRPCHNGCDVQIKVRHVGVCIVWHTRFNARPLMSCKCSKAWGV